MYKEFLYLLLFILLSYLIYLICLWNSKKYLITFIIPTIGRKTLLRTLNSLKNLKNKNWKAVIVFDGIEPNIKETDNRIKILKLNKKQGNQDKGKRNSAGNVRNYALNFVETKWVGFVDDDDTLNKEYIDKLIEHINKDLNLDLVIFRMRERNGKTILPKVEDKDFKKNEVGISFCLKSQVAKQFNFIPSETEDFDLLERIRSNGKKIIISDYIGYNVLV
jgi:glycosyltransferase involved in cell wall biosynthesis